MDNIWIEHWQYMEQYIANVHSNIQTIYRQYISNMQGHILVVYDADIRKYVSLVCGSIQGNI
jgi:hypothetical protein